MTASSAVLTAACFVWLGMVLAISFLEAPLKFRAPGVTLPVGLSIGRLVFRALNTVELVLAAVIVVALALDPPATTVVVTLTIAAATLAVQLAAVRPSLARRSNAVLAGGDAPRSHSHVAYIALEVVKVAALIAGGALLLVHATS